MRHDAGHGHGQRFVKIDHRLAIFQERVDELGRNEEAFEYLDKSLVLRRNLEHAKRDPNLEALRKFPEFNRIIAEAEGRLNE